MKCIFILLLSGLLSNTIQGQTEALPKPTGKHSIGVTYLSFTDDNRKELFDIIRKVTGKLQLRYGILQIMNPILSLIF